MGVRGSAGAGGVCQRRKARKPANPEKPDGVPKTGGDPEHGANRRARANAKPADATTATKDGNPEGNRRQTRTELGE